VEEFGVVGADEPCVPGHHGDGRNVREPQVVAVIVLRAPGWLGASGTAGDGLGAEVPGILRHRWPGSHRLPVCVEKKRYVRK
jgi:hypothetical protein